MERRFYRVLYRWSKIGSGRCCSVEQVGDRRRYGRRIEVHIEIGTCFLIVCIVSINNCSSAGKHNDTYQNHAHAASWSKVTHVNGHALPSFRSARTMFSLQDVCTAKRKLGLKQISLDYLNGLGWRGMSIWSRSRAYSTSRSPESQPKRRKHTGKAIEASGENETPINVDSATEITEKGALATTILKDTSSSRADSPTEYPTSDTLPAESPIERQTGKESAQENASATGFIGIRQSGDVDSELSVKAQLPDKREKKKKVG